MHSSDTINKKHAIESLMNIKASIMERRETDPEERLHLDDDLNSTLRIETTNENLTTHLRQLYQRMDMLSRSGQPITPAQMASLALDVKICWNISLSELRMLREKEAGERHLIEHDIAENKDHDTIDEDAFDGLRTLDGHPYLRLVTAG